MTGADLALLVNEAALFAARRGHESVEQNDFTDAIEKIILGTERQVVMTDADRERTAYHESGHALVGMLTPGADPVRKISIIPRGQALGVTLSTPESDRYGYEREELIAQDQGRPRRPRGRARRLRRDHDRRRVRPPAAHEHRARHGRALGDERRRRPDLASTAAARACCCPARSDVSEHTQQLIDEEVRRIVEDAERETVALLGGERHRLEALARALLERETLDQPEAYEIAGVDVPTRGHHGAGDGVRAGLPVGALSPRRRRPG